MREKKRKILLKAISELPQYSIEGNEVWSSIERELDQQEYDPAHAILQLPVFKTPEKVWDGIENRLNQKKTILKRVIDELPVFKAPDGSWEKIDIPSRKKHLRLVDFRKIAVAAILIIALGLGALLVQRQNKSGLTSMDNNYTSDSDEKSSSVGGLESIYNPALCAGNPEVCNSPEFKELAIQMKIVNAELKKLKLLLKQDNFQLRNYYYRLENEKVEIEKQMARLIIKS